MIRTTPLLLGLGLVLLVGCQTTEIGLAPPLAATELRDPIVINSYEQTIRVAQLSSLKNNQPLEPQFTQTKYWTATLLNHLGFGPQDFGYTEVSALDLLFFYTRPGWNIEGPFQEFFFPPPLDSPSSEERSLQVQQYFLPQGVGSLEPSPEGVLIFVFAPGDTITFLLFPNSPPMPAQWWSAIDSEVTSLAPTEEESEFRQFMTRAQGSEKELYLDPRADFLQKVLYDWESQREMNDSLEDLAHKAGDEEANILRLLLPQE